MQSLLWPSLLLEEARKRYLPTAEAVTGPVTAGIARCIHAVQLNSLIHLGSFGRLLCHI